MNTLRRTLQTLGWPADMTDAAIAAELLRRWFNADGPTPMLLSDTATLSDVAVLARGAYAALVRNLAALHWDGTSAAAADATPHIDAIMHTQQSKHDDADDDYILANRRKSARTPQPAPVEVTLDYGARKAMGWLVDLCEDGVGLLMEAGSMPTVGAQIEPVVHLRTGLADRMGAGLVVRTEALAHDMGLIGIELDEPRQNAAA